MSYLKIFPGQIRILLLPSGKQTSIMIKRHLKIEIPGNMTNRGIAFLAMKEAYKLGIMGAAQYLPDSLLISAEGNDAQLNQFVQWCTDGIPSVGLTDIKIKEGKVVGFTDFKIQSNNE